MLLFTHDQKERSYFWSYMFIYIIHVNDLVEPLQDVAVFNTPDNDALGLVPVVTAI